MIWAESQSIQHAPKGDDRLSRLPNAGPHVSPSPWHMPTLEACLLHSHQPPKGPLPHAEAAMPARPLSAFYIYSAACGIFSCVATGMFMPLFLERESPSGRDRRCG